MSTISISLNGETREVSGHINLDQLFALFSLPGQRIAVELNGEVVRRVEWPETPVSDGDKIEIVHFVGGG